MKKKQWVVLSAPRLCTVCNQSGERKSSLNLTVAAVMYWFTLAQSALLCSNLECTVNLCWHERTWGSGLTWYWDELHSSRPLPGFVMETLFMIFMKDLVHPVKYHVFNMSLLPLASVSVRVNSILNAHAYLVFICINNNLIIMLKGGFLVYIGGLREIFHIGMV